MTKSYRIIRRFLFLLVINLLLVSLNVPKTEKTLQKFAWHVIPEVDENMDAIFL